jgi:hypothetical protein
MIGISMALVAHQSLGLISDQHLAQLSEMGTDEKRTEKSHQGTEYEGDRKCEGSPKQRAIPRECL